MRDLNKGAHTSPNIQSDSEIYELENLSCDPENLIEQFLEETFNWQGKHVLDIGCGTGFHLPYFAKKVEHVFGVEPHDESRIKAMKRVSGLEATNISILKGTAEALTLKSDSIDFAVSRFAYFWGDERCEAGLEEVARVLKPNGAFVMIDNNLEDGTFRSWVKEAFNFSDSKQSEVNAFWKSNGFSLKEIRSEWRFETRSDLERVLYIEFSEEMYKKIISTHQGTNISYTFNLFYKQSAY